VDRAVAVAVYNSKYLFTFYDVCVYNEEKKSGHEGRVLQEK